MAASGLAAARITAPPVRFDDRTALDVLLVRGRPRAAASRTIAMLCLYDRRMRRAQATEADGWR